MDAWSIVVVVLIALVAVAAAAYLIKPETR